MSFKELSIQMPEVQFEVLTCCKDPGFFLRLNSHIRLNLIDLKEGLLLFFFSSALYCEFCFYFILCFQSNHTTLEFVFCFLDLVKDIYLFLIFYKVVCLVGCFFPRMEFSLLNAFILPLSLRSRNAFLSLLDWWPIKRTVCYKKLLLVPNPVLQTQEHHLGMFFSSGFFQRISMLID